MEKYRVVVYAWEKERKKKMVTWCAKFLAMHLNVLKKLYSYSIIADTTIIFISAKRFQSHQNTVWLLYSYRTIAYYSRFEVQYCKTSKVNIFFQLLKLWSTMKQCVLCTLCSLFIYFHWLTQHNGHIVKQLAYNGWGASLNKITFRINERTQKKKTR